MEQGLIERLAGYGPWGLAAAFLWLMRKEVAAVLYAPRDDRAVEQVLHAILDSMKAQNAHFAENNRTTLHLGELIDGIDTAIRDGVSVQRQILTELVRGGK